MPCLDISTNVDIDSLLDKESIFSELTKVVSDIIGKPKNFVMILLKGSVEITFGGSKEPAALAEIVSMGSINSEVKRKLIAEIGSILQNKMSIQTTRFVLNVFDATMAPKCSRL